MDSITKKKRLNEISKQLKRDGRKPLFIIGAFSELLLPTLIWLSFIIAFILISISAIQGRGGGGEGWLLFILMLFGLYIIPTTILGTIISITNFVFMILGITLGEAITSIVYLLWYDATLVSWIAFEIGIIVKGSTSPYGIIIIVCLTLLLLVKTIFHTFIIVYMFITINKQKPIRSEKAYLKQSTF